MLDAACMLAGGRVCMQGPDVRQHILSKKWHCGMRAGGERPMHLGQQLLSMLDASCVLAEEWLLLCRLHHCVGGQCSV
jgi:hypothetical protein